MNPIDHVLLAVTRTTDLAPSYLAPAESNEMPWGWLLLGVAIAIGFGFWLANKRRTPALIFSDDVTLDLCRAYGLGMPHRSVLELIRKRAGLEHTAEMFLSPKIFDAAVTKAIKSKRLGMRQRGLVFEARQCLFEPATT